MELTISREGFNDVKKKVNTFVTFGLLRKLGHVDLTVR